MGRSGGPNLSTDLPMGRSGGPRSEEIEKAASAYASARDEETAAKAKLRTGDKAISKFKTNASSYSSVASS
jgi:hypothetical protein